MGGSKKKKNPGRPVKKDKTTGRQGMRQSQGRQADESNENDTPPNKRRRLLHQNT